VPGRILPRAAIAPGASGFARVALDRPTVVRGGDRIVLRSWSPATTIGGGEVLDPLPPARASWPAGLVSGVPGTRLAALVERRRYGLQLADVPYLLGLPPVAVRAAVAEANLDRLGTRLVSSPTLAAAEARVLERLASHHRVAPQAAGLSVETLRRAVAAPEEWADALVDRLTGSGRIVVRDGTASLKGFRPQVDLIERALPKVLAALHHAGLQAPTADALTASLGEPGVVGALRLAESQGMVVQVEKGWWLAKDATDGFLALLRELGTDRPISLATVRDRTGLSRKFLIPLLEWADRAGITRREGENRVLIPPS
jgi:selenocysteine-specific elongation factor